LVLLAEDNDANADTITEYLMAKGYRLVRAVDGREALDLAARHQPQVILMDVQMPEMDGLEAIRHLRQTPSFKATPIIALTALAMPGDEARCLEAGASGYLSKPLRLQQLNQTLQQAIAAQLVVQGTGADD
jgi:CheY-like chemotaxis protein